MAGDLGDTVHGGLSVTEAVGEGKEIVVEHVLAGGGQGGHRPAVEGVGQGEDGPPPLPVLVKGVFAGQLDEALVGLGAGVGKEGRRHPRPAAQPLGQGPAGLGVEQVGHVAQLGRLDGHGVHPLGVGHADGIDADAGGEVDVLLALGTPEGGVFAVVDVHREAVVGVHHILVVPGFDGLKIHGVTS